MRDRSSSSFSALKNEVGLYGPQFLIEIEAIAAARSVELMAQPDAHDIATKARRSRCAYSIVWNIWGGRLRDVGGSPGRAHGAQIVVKIFHLTGPLRSNDPFNPRS